MSADLLHRITFQIETGWEFNLNDGWLAWIFTWRAEIVREHKRKKCFWPHAWLRVFGLWIGVGFFYSYVREA